MIAQGFAWYMMDVHGIYMSVRYISSARSIWAESLSREIDRDDMRFNPLRFQSSRPNGVRARSTAWISLVLTGVANATCFVHPPFPTPLAYVRGPTLELDIYDYTYQHMQIVWGRRARALTHGMLAGNDVR